MSVRIRAATADDVPFLAWVVLAASRSQVERGFFDLMIPDSEDERLAFVSALLRADPSWCHWPFFRVAEVDGEPAAALSGYAEGPELAKPEAILPAVARAEGWRDERLGAAFQRATPFLGSIPKTDPEAWNVEWVATDPGFRGQGLVGRLLEPALDEGRRRGHRTGQLLLLIDNAPAQRAYEKVGFRIVDEARSPEFEVAIGCPGLACMQVPL